MSNAIPTAVLSQLNFLPLDNIDEERFSDYDEHNGYGGSTILYVEGGILVTDEYVTEYKTLIQNAIDFFADEDEEDDE